MQNLHDWERHSLWSNLTSTLATLNHGALHARVTPYCAPLTAMTLSSPKTPRFIAGSKACRNKSLVHEGAQTQWHARPAKSAHDRARAKVLVVLTQQRSLKRV